jgi:multisubunit Na+/H+ antiporter MnhE subunit
MKSVIIGQGHRFIAEAIGLKAIGLVKGLSRKRLASRRLAKLFVIFINGKYNIIKSTFDVSYIIYLDELF